MFMRIICVLLIILQLVSIIIAIRKKCKLNWFVALATEIVSLAAGVGMTFYYNDLPGKGEAPGLTYFGEFFWGAGTTAVSILFLIISIIMFALQSKKMGE